MALAEPEAKAPGFGPVPVPPTLAPGLSQDSGSFPPPPPPSLPDTLPFVVDLEESGPSHVSHAPVPQPPDTVTPPPSPTPNPGRPFSWPAVIRSPGVSPGASSASWSVVPPVAPPPGPVPAIAFGPCSRWCRGLTWPRLLPLYLRHLHCLRFAQSLVWIARFRSLRLPGVFGVSHWCLRSRFQLRWPCSA